MTKIRDILTALFKNVCCAHARTLLLCVVFFLLCVAHKAVGAESPAVIELRKVQKVIIDKAEELKATDLAAYSTLMAASKDLDKYTKDSDIIGSKLLVQLLTPANLKKLFKAPVHLDKATGEVALGYDFNDPNTIQDWSVGNSRPEYKKGALVVPVAQSITHKGVFFGKLTVTGKVQCYNRQGVHFGLTSGLRLEAGSYNAWFINLTMPGTSKMQAQFSPDYTITADPDFIPFSVDVNAQTVAVKWGAGVTGNTSPAGFMGSAMLMGGAGGNLFKEIILTGTLDSNWIKQALGIGAP